MEKVQATSILKELPIAKLSMQLKDSLVAPVTDKEINQAMFSINGDKSPGPDGYNATFFTKIGM